MDAVVFDFDGVIVDSENLHDEALRDVCAPLGFSWEGEPFVGWPDADVLIELHRRRGIELSEKRLAELLEIKTRAVLRQVAAGLYHPYAGSVELIRAAAARGPVGVCSAGLRGQIIPVLERLDVLRDVAAVVSYEDTRASKPDPAPYLLAADKLGVDPARSVAIEDSPRGVASARAAGYRVVAVGHTSTRERLTQAHRFAPRISDLTLATLSGLFDARDDSD